MCIRDRYEIKNVYNKIVEGNETGQYIKGTKEKLKETIGGRLRDLGDAVSHGLEPFKVWPESLIPPALDGFEVPWLRWLVGERLEVGGETSTEVSPVVDAVSG